MTAPAKRGLASGRGFPAIEDGRVRDHGWQRKKKGIAAHAVGNGSVGPPMIGKNGWMKWTQPRPEE